MDKYGPTPSSWLLGVRNEMHLPVHTPPFNFQIKIPTNVVKLAPEIGDFIILALIAPDGARVDSRIRIDEIEIENDHLAVTGDPLESVVYSDAGNRPPTEISLEISPDELRFVELEDDDIQSIQSSVKAKWRTTFGEVPAAIKEVALAYSPKSVDSEFELTRSIEIGLRRSFIEESMIVTGGIPADKTPHSAVATILAKWALARNLVEVRASDSFWAQSVDLDLREATESDLKARSFKTPELDPAKLEDAAKKLARAEERHQFILADCVHFLRSIEIIPLLSSSVDLAIKRGSKLRVFEIKSSTAENFNSQFEKGLIQVARYKWEFESKFDPVLAALIIELPESSETVADEYFEFAEYLGIGLFLWDPSKEWPSRINNFNPWA